MILDVLRMIAALALTIAVYKHAGLWGWFHFNLYKMRAKVLVSYGYLRLMHRCIFCHLLHLGLLVATWLMWPFGHWGLLASVVSICAYRRGMRLAMLDNFVRQLLLHLDEGVSLEQAWEQASKTIKALARIRKLKVDGYVANPTSLIRYVVKRAKARGGTSDIEERWSKWLTMQGSVNGL